jgi:acetyltransferase-like isoleucine patch superfamily enzyme/glycosyltransferase involved in cell wall biosynthesis
VARGGKLIDVLIQTHNEELNLPHTLKSVAGWVNRVFVVDSGSTDATTRLAEDYGATVVHHPWEGYARQKNWALANLPFESPWILIIDADEAVSPELREEILELVRREPESVYESGFHLNRVFIFFGREIRHCGYFPSWNLRLFKRGRAMYEDRSVHEHMIVDGPVGYLQHLLIHEDRRGLEHFFAKHNRYSTLEAQEIYDRPEPWPGLMNFMTDRVARRRFGKSRILPYLPMPWMMRLLYMYVMRLGFMDGRAGWLLSNFISSYEFFVQLKYRELVRLHGTKPIAVQGLSVGEGLAPPKVAGTSDETVDETAEENPTSVPARELVEATPTARPAEPEVTEPKPVDPVKETPHHRAMDDRQRHAQHASRKPVKFTSPWTLRQNMARALWMIASALLFRPSFHNWYGWRRFLLRLFGASIGEDVRIRPTVKVEIPWNLDIDDGSIVGDHAILYSLGKITLGKRVVISQYAHLCAGTHDYRYKTFPLVRPPITIHDEAWVAADAFVGPGVTMGERSILGARASAFRDIQAGMIAAGNPARDIKPRESLDPLDDTSHPTLAHAANV